ncbi:hypothetical protein BJV77DRAFT_973374 [Russula vinacea]|nr:hypothetical protein BJV77DRAFT_973374 [Russula vinacea]
MAGRKRHNPKTLSPKKKLNKKARVATLDSDVYLPGGALQTSFHVEATPIATTTCVTFNPVVTTGSGNTAQLRPAHGSDSDDPFVGSGNSDAAGQTAGSLFSSDFQNIHTLESPTGEDFNLHVSPTSLDSAEPLPAPSRHQQAQIQAKPVGSRTADVFSFYETDCGKKKCTFCLYVFIYLIFTLLKDC